MHHVLITGASGFLGGALGRHLRAHGYRVSGWSRRPPRPGSTDEHLCIDLSREKLPDTAFDAVVHCAALASPWAPRGAFQLQNVETTRRVLKLKTAHFIFISSSSVHYAWGDQLDLTETTPLPEQPINEYARSKRLAEALVTQSPAPHAILRPRAIFGPEDTVLFPRILRAARSGSLPRILRDDGRPALADLIYIDNLTHMIRRAIQTRAQGIYNLTNAEPVDTYGFLASIFSELGYPPITRSIPARWAFRLARALEWSSALTANRWEPPLTRFGVEVMVHSKTFNVAKSIQAFGPIPIPIEEARGRFVAWQRETDVRGR